MLASHALALIGVPLARVIRRIRDIRDQRYALMRGFFHGGSDALEGGEMQSRLQSLVLAPGAYAIGRQLSELDLDGCGVKVSAIRRRDIRASEPGPDTRFEAGDVVVLLGEPLTLERATQRLLKGD